MVIFSPQSSKENLINVKGIFLLMYLFLLLKLFFPYTFSVIAGIKHGRFQHLSYCTRVIHDSLSQYGNVIIHFHMLKH